MKYRAIVSLVVILTPLAARAQFLGDALAAAGFAESEEEAAAGLAAIIASGRTPREVLGTAPNSTANVYEPYRSAGTMAPPASTNTSAPPPSGNLSQPQYSTNVSAPQGSTNILHQPNVLGQPPGTAGEPVAQGGSTVPSGSVPAYTPPGAGSSFAGSGKYYTPEEVSEWKAGFAPVGTRVDAPPPGSETVSGNFKYSKGVFYKPEGNKWVVVPAPVGARVRERPAAGSGILYKNVPYTYYNGAFYVWNREANAADVVAPPVGATVTYIPESAVKQERDGKPCYVYGNTCFRPTFRGSTVVYTIA